MERGVDPSAENDGEDDPQLTQFLPTYQYLLSFCYSIDVNPHEAPTVLLHAVTLAG